MNNLNASHAASAYRRASSAIPSKMAMVRLHDSAIVRIHRAINAIEAKRLDEGFAHVNHAAAILRGLSHFLDFERGGELAEQLYRMYSKNITALLGSLGRPNAVASYRSLAEGLAELRDAWAEIAGVPTRAQEMAPKPSPRPQ